MKCTGVAVAISIKTGSKQASKTIFVVSDRVSGCCYRPSIQTHKMSIAVLPQF